MLGGWTLRIGTRRATARAIQPVRRHTVATRPNPAGGVPGNRRSRAVEPPGNRENHCLTDIEGSRADDPGHRSGSALPIGKSSHIAYASSVADLTYRQVEGTSRAVSSRHFGDTRTTEGYRVKVPLEIAGYRAPHVDWDVERSYRYRHPP